MNFAIVAIILDNVFGIAFRELGFGPIYLFYGLVVFLPGLAVSVRRLHDIGKSGWMIFISLIPFIGSIWLLILMATEGDSGKNEYGLDPKNPEEEDLYTFSEVEEKIDKNSNSDTIIFTIILWMLTTFLFWSILPKIISEFNTTNIYLRLSNIFNFIWGFIPLVLSFAVKDKSKQMILFIISGIYFLLNLYNIIQVFLF